jgi:TRAP transporter TAXI family solute receptor
MMDISRRALLGGGVALAAASLASTGWAQEPRFFRIATGPTESDYFAVGTLIGGVVSSPPGSRDCDRGGSCGVPGLIAVTQTTAGTLANVAQISRRQLDSALVPADIAYWAQSGTGPFARQAPAVNLRAIATLFPETVHIVVRRDAGIGSIGELRRRAVSLGERESGTMATARTILRAAGVADGDLEAVFLKPSDAATALRDGRIDALFEVAAAPSALIADLAQATDIDLLPIPPALAEQLRLSVPYYAASTIAADRYRGVEETETASFGTMWVVTSETDDKTVYELARALLHPSNRRALDQGNPLGRLIRPDTVLDGMSLEIHAGAAQYYREAGLLKG